MGYTIRHIYDNKINALAMSFAKLASPCRLTLITLLYEKGAMSTKELADEIGTLSPSTISQHLSDLRSEDLVRDVHIGTTVLYSLDEEMWERFGNTIKLFFERFNEVK